MGASSQGGGSDGAGEFALGMSADAPVGVVTYTAEDLPLAPPMTVKPERAFPTSVNYMTLQELSDAMQAAAGLVSWAESLMSQVEAAYISACEDTDHRQEIAVARIRLDHPELAAVVGKTVDTLRAYVVEHDHQLKAAMEYRWELRSQKHRLEHLIISYAVARDTLSRQLTYKQMEAGAR